MFDWAEKITCLLELPGLTGEQAQAINAEAEYVTFEPAGHTNRTLETGMLLVLERLIEAHGTHWGVWLEKPEDLDPWQLSTPYRSWVVCKSTGVEAWQLGATSAQAVCNAVLTAFGDARG